MSTHTPGPWTANGADVAKPYYINGPDGEVIVNGSNEEYGVIGRANARLIAAAPELLEACMTADSILQVPGHGREYDEIRNMLKDAIAKATGETE